MSQIGKNDTTLKLVQLSTEAWNERKNLMYATTEGEKKRTIDRLEKIYAKVNALKFTDEIDFLRDFFLRKDK